MVLIGFILKGINMFQNIAKYVEYIEMLISDGSTDQLQMQRLKKHKLLLKDEILYYENELLPNIIA